VREASFKPARLVGSSPEALASAVRAIVAMEARCSPGEVGLAILGAPPDGFVLAWSEASIGGYALEAVLTQVQMARIEARTRRLWPPQPYALGMAAAMVAEAIVGSARRAFNVLALLEGEFGVRNRVGTLPVLLSTTGIVHRRVPSLSTRERVRLETVLGS
jgi:malate/lactate dehydrogenase